MTFFVKDASVWKPLSSRPWVNDAGVWKEVVRTYVRDAGVWKPVDQPFELVDYTASPTNFATLPATTPVAGDLLVFVAGMWRYNATPSETLAGYTLIKASSTLSLYTDRYRIAAWYRVCDGTETEVAYEHDIVDGSTFLFRGARPITGVQVTPGNNWTAQVTGGNPALQTIAAGGLTGPLVSIGAAKWTSTFTTNAPVFNRIDRPLTEWITGVTVYDTDETCVDQTVDVGDNGYDTYLISGFIIPQF